MNTQFSDQDFQHLNTFPPYKKTELINKAMARAAAQQRTCYSNGEYELMLAKLRRDGYSLIDFQPLETAFTTMWYRKTSKLLGLAQKEDVVMLVWQCDTRHASDSVTMVSMWEL